MYSTLTERAAHGSKQCLEMYHDKKMEEIGLRLQLWQFIRLYTEVHYSVYQPLVLCLSLVAPSDFS